MNALGLEWKDLFQNDPKPFPKTHSSGGVAYFASSSAKLKTVYPYTDENGKLLYENVRFEPKDFRQRQFDPAGKPIWNLQGVERVPYRLKTLANNIRFGSDVYFTEGEKDAELDRGRVSVVRGLRAVHVVVRMQVFVLAFAVAEQLEAAVCDDFVRIHVGGRARAALDHVDGKLIVKLPGHDLVTGSNDRTSLGGIESRNGDLPDGVRRAANLEDVFVLLTGEEVA